MAALYALKATIGALDTVADTVPIPGVKIIPGLVLKIIEVAEVRRTTDRSLDTRADGLVHRVSSRRNKTKSNWFRT